MPRNGVPGRRARALERTLPLRHGPSGGGRSPMAASSAPTAGTARALGEGALDHLTAQAKLADRRSPRYAASGTSSTRSPAGSKRSSRRDPSSPRVPTSRPLRRRRAAVTTAEGAGQAVPHEPRALTEVIEEEFDRYLLDIGCLRALRLLACGTHGEDPYDAPTCASRSARWSAVREARRSVARSGEDWFITFPHQSGMPRRLEVAARGTAGAAIHPLT